MKPYGYIEKDNSVCGWGCCFHPSYTHRQWNCRKLVDRAKRKKARREGKSQTKEVDFD